MNKKHNVKIIKNFAKISALILSLVFSLNSVGEQNIINCNQSNLQTYSDAKWYIQRHPNDNDFQSISTMRIMAQSAFCIGKEKEGLELLKRLFSMGHIHATFFLGVYHATGGTLNTNYWLDQNLKNYQEHFDAAIYYFETAAGQIMSAVNYPEGVNPDQPDMEAHNRTSAKVFIELPNFYYEGYMRAVENILADSKRGKKVYYTDTIVALVKMRHWSEQCLKRPALDMWKNSIGTANAMKAYCQEMNNFAVQVLPLEQQRIKIVADQCKDALLHKCPEHQNIFNQITELSNTMREILKLVPQG